MRLLILITVIAFTTISGWIVAFQMRRRMRKTLGRKVTDTELVSITTWMKVEDQEERDEQNRPVTPK
jgi:hypothetical protein